MKARWENALCVGKVLGDKRGNRLSSVLCSADRPSFVSHPVVRRSHNFHSFLISFPPSPPVLHELLSPLCSSPCRAVLKRSERENNGVCSVAQLLINMQIFDLLRALIVGVEDYETE